MRIYTLQTESFPAILQQKSTAGVSLAVDFSLVLQNNFPVWSAAQFGIEVFSSRGYSEDAGILDVFQGRWIFTGKKDSFKTV